MDINFLSVFLLSIKIVLLVILVLYFIFSLVMLEKVKFLSKILNTSASSPLVWLVLVNVLAAAALFFLSLIFL